MRVRVRVWVRVRVRDDVRHPLGGVAHHHPALQPRDGAEVSHADEHVAGVEVRVDHVIPHDHLEQRLYAEG